MTRTGSMRHLVIATLFTAFALLPGCATTDADPRSGTGASPTAAPALVPFASDEGLARLARAKARADFAPLANQFEAQYNEAFCGPTSAAIVLNALRGPSAERPRDRARLRQDDLRFLPPGLDPIVPRHTQDSVIDRGRKTRAQVLGEPTVLGGKTVRDFGYQLHQFDEMLRAHGLGTRRVVVDDTVSEQTIRTELAANLAQEGNYVVVNYRREAAGQKGGGHISPVGAYDAASDSFLVLDVNPAAAGWVWMNTSTLARAMRTFDTVENRGYVLIQAKP